MNSLTATGDQSFKRIEFCDALRTLAVLLVVLAHYIVGFSLLDQFLYNSNEMYNFYSFYQWFNWIDGAYGVAIFFLVSGFLIPISLKRYGIKGFLVARFFRLIPTYAICLLLVLLIGLLFGTFSLTGQLIVDYFKNISLMRDVIGGTTLDSVIWTLEIEVKFYLYLSTIYFFLRGNLSYGVFINPLFQFFLISVLGISYKFSAVICFMFIGVCFYLLVYGDIKEKKIALFSALINFSMMVYFFGVFYQNYTVAIVYSISLAVFLFFYAAFYIFNLRTPKYVKFIANISYPTYAIHSIGYVFLSYLGFKMGMGQYALPITLVILFGFAFVINKYVELPSIDMGKKLRSGTSYE